MEFITTYCKLLHKLRICNLCYIRISVILFISGCIVIHRLFQCGSNTNIIDNKSTFLVTENTIYTCNRLHQIVSCHRLIYIHSSKRRYIKSCQPHINNNGYLHRAVVIFELLCKFIPMMLVSNNLSPFLRIIISGSHNNAYLLSPIRV